MPGFFNIGDFFNQSSPPNTPNNCSKLVNRLYNDTYKDTVARM